MVFSDYRTLLRKVFNPISLLVLGAGLAMTLAAASPASANVRINIDKSTQKMDVIVDGQPRYRWDVSTGIAGHDTPSGTYKPNRMEIDHYSKQYDDAPMPYSIFFTQYGHAIHGTMDQRYMGQAASHGCVRLLPKNAAVLWDIVKAEGMGNTTVSITGQIPGGPGAVAQQAPDRSFWGRRADTSADRRYVGPGYYQTYEDQGLSRRELRRLRRQGR